MSETEAKVYFGRTIAHFGCSPKELGGAFAALLDSNAISKAKCKRKLSRANIRVGYLLSVRNSPVVISTDSLPFHVQVAQLDH